MSLLSLPGEILSSIIVLLDIPSAVKCQRVCKRLHQVATSELVYRDLCRKAGYLKPQQTLEDLAKPHRQDKDPTAPARPDGHSSSAWNLGGRQDNELASYKDLLVSSWKLEWEKDHGDVTVAGGTNYSYDTDATHIRIDHIDELMIVGSCSSSNTEIRVLDMRTGHVISSVACGPGRMLFDYDQGWLVLNGTDRRIGVWCFERNTLQEGQARRGWFCPRGPLESVGDQVHAVRLKFPHILLVTLHHLLIYDLLTWRPVEVVEIDRELMPFGLSNLHHLEFDEDFVWVIGGDHSDVLYALCRRTGKLLWHLPADPYDWPAELITAYAFKPSEETNIAGTGRKEQEVKPIRWTCPEPFSEWGTFGAVYADEKSGCLCLKSENQFQICLIILPHYKDLTQGISAARSLISLTDSNDVPHGDLPSWVKPMRFVPSRALAVADGRAAFATETGVALVDLQKLLLCHFGNYSHADDPKGGSERSNEGDRPFSSCVNVWSAPHAFEPRRIPTMCVALTATCLAWAGCVERMEAWTVPQHLREHAPEEVYVSKLRRPTIWIDFAKMRNHEVDTQRAQEEERRISILRKCEAEIERRIAATDDGQYTLHTGDKVKDIMGGCRDPMNAVAALLAFGEFFQVGRWIDFDALRAKLGEGAAETLRLKFAMWEQEEIAAKFNPLRPVFLELNFVPPHSAPVTDRAQHDLELYDEDAWMVQHGMPPMSEMSESFQDFFGGQAMDVFGGLQDEEDMMWDDEGIMGVEEEMMWG